MTTIPTILTSEDYSDLQGLLAPPTMGTFPVSRRDTLMTKVVSAKDYLLNALRTTKRVAKTKVYAFSERHPVLTEATVGAAIFAYWFTVSFVISFSVIIVTLMTFEWLGILTEA